MSYLEIFSLLTKFGLSETDVQIYLHLAIKGPQPAKHITEKLNLPERRVNRSLKILSQKQIITAPAEYIARYAAVPFEDVLSRLQTASLRDAIRIEQKKQDALAAWRALTTER